MKALPKQLLPLTLLGIAVTASLFSVRPAQAYTITLEQVGSNVAATGSGAINLTELTFVGGILFGTSVIAGNLGLILTGAPSGHLLGEYTGFTGPTSFGSGGVFNTSGSGDLVGVFGDIGLLFVPEGYVSGAPLSSSATFNNATFASLGVTPGTYVWTWGIGANQNFTLQIRPATVPDSPVGLPLIAVVFVLLFAAKQCELRRSRTAALPQI